MDIPNIMAGFGENQDSTLMNVLLKSVSIMSKDKDKELLNVFMDFNLNNKFIEFDIVPYDVTSEKRYNYFGNNPAAAKQIYAVRDVNSIINYWTGRPSGIFKNILDFVCEGELKSLLEECRDIKLFDIDGINTEYIKFVGTEEESKISIDKKAKAIYINDDKISAEKFVSRCAGVSGNSKIILVIPRIIKDEQKIIISKHTDYVRCIAKTLEGEELGNEGVCHICGMKRSDINTKEYSSKLSKSSIGKVFVTTTVNYAPMFARSDHQRNYGICKNCYENLMFGEKKVMNDFKLKIAREDSVILFEGIDKPIEKDSIEKIKKDIDLVFNPAETQIWIDEFKIDIKDFQEIQLYQFNIIFYKTDGKSCAIKKTIENISNIRFEYIKDVFEDTRRTFEEKLKYFTLGHLYNIVPVSTAKDGTQLNISRLLNLYGSIIKSELIDKNCIFDLACEALEKGVNQLTVSQVRNYKNLYKLMFLESKDYGVNVYINKIMMSYIALFHVFQRLDILDREVFRMEEEKVIDENLPVMMRESENFLLTQGFSKEAKGLFYIGMLMYQVGTAQYKQEHKAKPILDKVTYTGMNNNDVLTLYMEILDKTRQYKKYVNLWICEKIEKQIHKNLANLTGVKFFTEKENVFFIMAGYAYCVGNYKKDDLQNSKIEDEMEEGNND